MYDPDAIKCQIYRSPRQEGMYLYLHARVTLDELPAALLKSFGRPEPVMELELSAQRRLAREDVTVVMQNLEEQGFHLQMPPDPIRAELHDGD